MHLCEVTEYATYGLSFTCTGTEPIINRPAGCPFDIRFHPRVVEHLMKQSGEGLPFRIGTASVDFHPGLLLLKPEVSSPSDRRGPIRIDTTAGTFYSNDQQLLLRLGTAGGVGGKAYLTANVLEEKMDQGRVSKHPSPFPSLGVQPLCTDEELARLQKGVEAIDLLLLMNPGANFCVRRTGGLEGAPPVLAVKWSPWERSRPPLMIDHPMEKRPGHARAMFGAPAFAG
jgi:hypothetical protein